MNTTEIKMIWSRAGLPLDSVRHHWEKRIKSMRVIVILIVPVLFWPCMGVAEENADFPAMKIDHLYTGEEFTNLSGGIKKGHSHRGNLDLTITIDTEKAGLWKGGELHLYYENGLGKGITREYVGDLQVLSNIDAHDFSQISEYYIGQFFLAVSYTHLTLPTKRIV